MATQSPGISTPLTEFTAALLAENEITPRTRTIAAYAADIFPNAGVAVYLAEEHPVASWIKKAEKGELRVSRQSIPAAAGALGRLWRDRESFTVPAAQLAREDYAHLDLRRSFASLTYVPIMLDDILLGAIEVVNFSAPASAGDIAVLEQMSDYAALALASGATYENERNSLFKSINRLTQLYDLERTFNSTLEMERLLPIITSKLQEVFEVEGVNLWMVQQDDMVLTQRSGADPTVELGDVCQSGEGIPAEIADSGKCLILRRGDPRLIKRNREGDGVRALVAAPIVSQDFLVGAIELVNKQDGTAFTEDDAFFLSTISLTAASALHNASLLEAERKIEILETLVKVSQEITSTLNLDRVLQVVVNGPQRIVSYERASVALEHHGKLQLKAISGKLEFNPNDAMLKRLRELLEWASISREELYVSQQKNGDITAEREETQAKFKEYFAQTGIRGFYAIPLLDDQGLLGMLSFESRDPDFLNDAHFELIRVIAGQATVAVRNASLYTEVPFIGLLQPMLQKKQEFMRMEKRRRAATLGLAVATVLFLVFCPLPMRVSGGATVGPQQTAQVQPAVEGVVKKVYVKEGDPVQKGTILADLDDWDYRAALSAAESKHAIALSEMNRALAVNDGTEAGVQRVRADYLASEVARAHDRLDQTHLRSPIDGVVATPHIENSVGHKLVFGDSFAEVLNSSSAQVDVSVDEAEVALLKAGDGASVKLESFPTQKFTGKVELVSPMGGTEADHRVFFARVKVPNQAGTLRPGMQGRSKIMVGWYPAGYVFFRPLGMWGWAKLWWWFGW